MTEFAKELRAGTKKSHTMVESTGFMAGFLRGVVNKEQYSKLVTNFYFVYRAMEDEIYRLRKHPVVGKIYFPPLERIPQLEKDMEYFYGSDWRNLIAPSEACQKYVNRIREVSDEQPELLIAHHYTRYLGDLSGGQILKGIAANAMGIEEGLSFYDFPQIADVKGFKESYRTILDALSLTTSQQNAIIVEANYAFRLNMYMFDELEGNELKSLIKMVCGFIKKWN
jgi:heme oxygenase